MSIVTFWSELNEETGQTGTAVAVATKMAIDHNMRILLITTQYKNDQIENSFWDIGKEKKNLLSFLGTQKDISLDSGIDGLIKAVASNRLEPEITTNYTRIVFKDRLEVLGGYRGNYNEFDKVRNVYLDLIKTSARYYDMVIVDLSKELDLINKTILEKSDLIVYSLNQRSKTIDHYIKDRQEGFLAKKKNVIPFLGKYDKDSKYNSKNVSRYVRTKLEMNGIPYNTLFFEATNEGNTADYFLKMRTIKKEDDVNVQFINAIEKLIENMIYKLQELQMKM